MAAFLLDTCTFLWTVLEPERLSAKAVNAYANQENQIYLSTVSLWEISLKYGLGHISLQEPPDVFLPAQVAAHSIELLPLHAAAAAKVYALPAIHKDPFDRMLVSQALAHELVLVTPDAHIKQYPVQTLW